MYRWRRRQRAEPWRSHADGCASAGAVHGVPAATAAAAGGDGRRRGGVRANGGRGRSSAGRCAAAAGPRASGGAVAGSAPAAGAAPRSAAERRALHRSDRRLGRRRRAPTRRPAARRRGGASPRHGGARLRGPGGGGGGGGGTVPRPNRAGEALGSEGSASAPPRPRAARWCGRRSARWRCWPARRDRALGLRRHDARFGYGWSAPGRRRPLARRSCRPAGRATNSPGSSRPGTTNSPPAAAPTTARGGRRPEVPDSRRTSLNPPPCTPRLPATSAAQHRRIRSRPCPDVACGGADGKDAYGRPGQDRNHRVQAARPGGDRSLHGRHRRTLAAHRRRMAEAPGGARSTRRIR